MSEEMAKAFHEAYERLAPSFGYDTRKESAVPWEDVPEKNRKLMIEVTDEVMAESLAMIEILRLELERVKRERPIGGHGWGT